MNENADRLPPWPLPLSRGAAELDRMIERVIREVGAAQERLEELMGLPAGARRSAVRQRAAFQLPCLARLLLVKARALPVLGRERAEMVELALAVAERLAAPVGAVAHPRAIEALALSGRVWAGLGAERRAEERFARLAAALAGGPDAGSGRTGRADLCHGLAQLRWRQGRLEEAAGLFGQAAELWSMAGRSAEAVVARAQEGLVHLDGGADPAALDAGRRALQVAHARLEPRVAALSARVALGLGFSLAALGSRERAAELRQVAGRLVGAVGAAGTEPGTKRRSGGMEAGGCGTDGESSEHWAWRWWGARIEAASGRAGAAGEQLEDVRLAMLAGGSLAEAARTSVDLAEVRIELGQLEGLPGLGEDLVRTFGRDGAGEVERLAGLFAELPGLAVGRAGGGDGGGVRDSLDPVTGRIRAALWGLRRLWFAGGGAGRRLALIRGVPELVERFLVAGEVGS